MNWLNIDVKRMAQRAFTASTTAQLGTWLRLMAYCAEQENGGRIENSREWIDRQWLMSVGIERADLEPASELWAWTETGALRVEFYPKEQEIALKLKRKGGQRGGKAKWAKKKHPASLASDSANGSANGSASRKEEEELKGKRNNQRTQTSNVSR